MSEGQFIVEDGVVAGNAYDKYGTRNPVARALMANFLKTFRSLVARAGGTEVHEVGCGEGQLAIVLRDMGLRVRGSDFSRQVLAEAERNAAAAGVDLPLKAASLYDLTEGEDAAELIVCCEVLEHLENPDRALDVLAELARPYLVASVPREPLWRVLNLARGKYVTDLGNTPGHLNHWTKRGFVRFLRRRLDVLAVRSPLPWTMVLCRSRSFVR